MMLFFTGPLPVQCGGGRRPGSLTDATQDCSTSEDFSPRTVLTKNICRCDHHILQHFPNNNALSNNLRNNLFLDSLNSYPGWLLVTLTRGAWWCRYRGHCRSGPRHLSPRSRVCAQEWHWKDIHSHIHSHTPMHTPKKVQKQQQQNAQLTKHDAFVSWSYSCAVCWWPIFRKLGTWSTTDALSARTLLTENICESVQEILQLSPAEKKRKNNKKKQQRSTHKTWCLSLLVLFLSNVVVDDGQEAWQMLLRTFSRRRTSRLGQYWQKTFVDVFTTYCNISRQQCPF